MKRIRWSTRRILAAGVATLIAAVPFVASIAPAGDFASDAFTKARNVFDPPSTAEQAVDRLVAEAEQKMPWERVPTIYEPSVDLLRKRFATLNPERTHALTITTPEITADIPALVAAAPQFQGHLIAVRAKFGNATQVSFHGSVTSWAFFLYERRSDPVVLVCRVPLATARPPEFVPGEKVYVTGVLLADGAAYLAGRPGLRRVLYMACSAVGHVTTFSMSVGHDKRGRKVGVVTARR